MNVRNAAGALAVIFLCVVNIFLPLLIILCDFFQLCTGGIKRLLCLRINRCQRFRLAQQRIRNQMFSQFCELVPRLAFFPLGSFSLCHKQQRKCLCRFLLLLLGICDIFFRRRYLRLICCNLRRQIIQPRYGVVDVVQFLLDRRISAAFSRSAQCILPLIQLRNRTGVRRRIVAGRRKLQHALFQLLRGKRLILSVQHSRGLKALLADTG